MADSSYPIAAVPKSAEPYAGQAAHQWQKPQIQFIARELQLFPIRSNAIKNMHFQLRKKIMFSENIVQMDVLAGCSALLAVLASAQHDEPLFINIGGEQTALACFRSVSPLLSNLLHSAFHSESAARRELAQ